MNPAPRRTFLVVLASALLVQCAWALALPAFRGMDEFDHVFRAAGVAHGQLRDGGPTDAGRGRLVTVPEHVVTAASATCESYDYTGRGNCHPIEQVGGGMVTVASGAGTYNPAYYAVVGVVALPFEGAAVDFAIRAANAVIVALLLAWAAVVTSGWARNAWPMLALLVAATPTLFYSASVASPNGVGYAAAALLWASALRLVEQPGPPRLLAPTVAALVMLATHTTGSLWLAIIAVVVALLRPAGHWWALARRWPRQVLAAAATIGLGAVACVGWIRLAGTNSVPLAAAGGTDLTVGDLLASQVVWLLQAVGAFPMRDEPAPLVVYVAWAVPLVSLLVLGLRRADRRTRLGAALLAAAWIAVPTTLTVLTFASEGLAWQGRYALPLAMGVPALAGLALHRTSRGPGRWVCAAAVTSCGLAHTISCAGVALSQSGYDLAPAFTDTVPAASVWITLLALGGSLLPLLLLRRTPVRGEAVPTSGTPTAAPAVVVA